MKQLDYQTYIALKNLLIKVANNEDFSTEFSDTDLEPEPLKLQLQILYRRLPKIT